MAFVPPGGQPAGLPLPLSGFSQLFTPAGVAARARREFCCELCGESPRKTTRKPCKNVGVAGDLAFADLQSVEPADCCVDGPFPEQQAIYERCTEGWLIPRIAAREPRQFD